MNNDKDAAQLPEEDLDIFKSAKVTNHDAVAGNADGAESVGEKGNSRLAGIVAKLKPVHFMAVAGLAAVAWIAWPFLGGGSHAQQNAGASNTLTPDQAMVDGGQPEGRLQPANEPASAASATAVGPTAADVDSSSASKPVGAQAASAASAVTPASNPAQVRLPVSPPNENELKLQATVERQELLIGELQAQISTAQLGKSCTATVMNPRVGPSLTTRHQHRHVTEAPRVQDGNGVSPAVRNVSAAPHGLVLNTIYRDEAWIQSAERTYVVQAGDVIDGIRIISVDATKREVVTSQGTIR
ncbi:conserved hypothetical protein [Burkholderia diffusa]|uniref:hypothetical protein n=1 Tax=Burkholderia diffusa TaxID=488732 RepID=UPI001CB14A4A|nr:hypothetical protein [Burkholderia diffusa]CAG9260891.1 conserved hypothetical protein [Burkholderia diffusa]